MSYTHRMTALPAHYDTDATEKKWQQHWLAQGTYAWADDDRPENARANSFVIDTPPPTVSGTLHMGHVYSYTQADFIARFQRMQGKNVFYPMGFDDNGLPTERLVEKTIKKRAVDMSREDFIGECMKVSEEARVEFRHLFQSIALSVDWAQEYHTISESSRRLSQLSFLDMVEKNECYRAMRPFYWDPVDQTAIAAAEIVDKEIASAQHVILFSVDGASVPVMTTRPELLPACVALMYHPDDAGKYARKTAKTPLFQVDVPMVADEKVDREKGTGLVMCCTFGDDTDKEWWEKHALESRVILNKYGKLDLSALPFFSSPLAGVAELCAALNNKKTTSSDPKHPGAREIIVAALQEAGLLVSQTPITHTVKCAERSGAPLEILPTQQWFVKVVDKKEALKQKAAASAWNPDWMRLRIEQWIDGLNQDWCISRQRYFGVPFPVWYEYPLIEGDPRATFTQTPQPIYAAANQLPVNPIVDLPNGYYPSSPHFDSGDWRLGLDPTSTRIYKSCVRTDGTKVFLLADPDVMDTWATSSISPQLSAGALSAVIPAKAGIQQGASATRESILLDSSFRWNDGARGNDGNARFSKLFPADLRPQAHEIIRTWAFYTIVKAHIHNDSVPWHNLMISGWCLAEDKTKMSKSKGNVVTPVALIEERGADAVRYWAATSRLGQDTAFSPDLLKIGKKLLNKLWNATAFAAIHLEKMTAPPATAQADIASGAITATLDQWILTRLQETVAKATAAYTRYEYADALDATNQFFWADFCDNYLELIKKRVYNEDASFTPEQQQSAVRTLYYCLQGILQLYAPVVPHVTEELYSHIFADDYAAQGSLHARGNWPKSADYPQSAEALRWGAVIGGLLEQLRKAKSDAKRSIKTVVTLAVVHLPAPLLAQETALLSAAEDLRGAGNIEQLQWVASDDASAPHVDVTLAAEAEAA